MEVGWNTVTQGVINQDGGAIKSYIGKNMGDVPSGILLHNYMERSTIFHGTFHYKW